MHDRESLDAGTVASGASIKAGEPGEALHREAFDADDVPRPSTWPASAEEVRRFQLHLAANGACTTYSPARQLLSKFTAK